PQAIENYDAMLVLADAITRAKSTDGKAIIAALEKTDIVLGRGRYTFSTSRQPDWAYHQFMNAPVALVQFDKVGQAADDAPIVWPRDIATAKPLSLKPAKWAAARKCEVGGETVRRSIEAPAPGLLPPRGERAFLGR